MSRQGRRYVILYADGMVYVRSGQSVMYDTVTPTSLTRLRRICFDHGVLAHSGMTYDGVGETMYRFPPRGQDGGVKP